MIHIAGLFNRSNKRISRPAFSRITERPQRIFLLGLIGLIEEIDL